MKRFQKLWLAALTVLAAVSGVTPLAAAPFANRNAFVDPRFAAV